MKSLALASTRAPTAAPPDVALGRFRSPEQLLAGVAEVIGVAVREDVRMVLVGAFAMQCYGVGRLTADLAFAASGPLRGLASTEPLPFGGVRTATSGGVRVDVIVRDDDFRSLYDDLVAAAPLVPALGTRVATPEHLTASKMAAGRGKHALDLKLLLVRDGLVDVVRTRAIIREHLGPYAAKMLDRLADEVARERHLGGW